MLTVLVFRLSGQAGTGALRQLLNLWLLQKAKEESSNSPSVEQQQLHLQQTPWCWKATHRHVHTRKRMQFLETNIINLENLDSSEILQLNNTHTNTYLIFRRRVYQSILTPLKFTEISHWLQIPSYDCQDDVQMEKRDQQEVSTSTDIQHKANVISLQQF